MNYFISISTLISVAMAQNVAIGAPARGAHLTVGHEVDVQVQRPSSLTSSNDIGIAIAIGSTDVSPDKDLGNLVYKGTFTPEVHEASKPAYQNITVTIPYNYAKGDARLNVAHAGLVGAGSEPFLETITWPITIV